MNGNVLLKSKSNCSKYKSHEFKVKIIMTKTKTASF